ncbi:3-deoxy-D-manno-octulosonic acid transferase [Thermodesulfobacteriota bacterium]
MEIKLNPLLSSYRLLSDAALASFLPFFWVYTRATGKYRRHLPERLGVIPSEAVKKISGSPRIWIHAVSLGEVQVAAAVVRELKGVIPECSIIISTFTEHGRDLAEDTFGKEIPVIYSPLDARFAVKRSLEAINPDVMIFMETELWPAWIMEAGRMGIKTALINGRISERSIKGYRRVRLFLRPLLRNFHAFSMISSVDAERIKEMGAEAGRVVVNGSAKYDLPKNSADPSMERAVRKELNLDSSQPVFVAGSTRDGEEALVLRAYEKITEEFPETVLILVPRHINRLAEIEAVLKKKGLKYQLRTGITEKGEKRTEKILIMNTFGELFKVYSVGTIVFCGGSLVPLGGQNPLEPAAWGKMVFYGPSMYNFLDAKALLEGIEAGVEVENPEALAEKAVWFLNNPEILKARGAGAPEAIEKNRGAAKRHAEVIAKLAKDS